MIIWSNSVENVLSRIYLEGVARNGRPPQIYVEAIQALAKLDKTCLTVNSNSDPNCPVGWRRNNYPLITVGKKSNKLKFSYTKEYVDNGVILVIVEEVADAYGNILTEDIYNTDKKTKIMNTYKKVVRLTESQLHNIISESVKSVLNELDARTLASAADKAKERSDARFNKFRNGAIDRWNDEYGYKRPSKNGFFRP